MIVASALLGGCGWHLRGHIQLPESLATAYISTEDEYTDFYRELKSALMDAGASMSPRQADAGAVVRIRKEAVGQRVAAVSARNTPEEFQVYYAVDYSLDVRGAEVLPPQHVELTANYSYDTAVVLAKQREQRSIQQSLARELANQVLRRLAVAKPEQE
jgi:LPS-assembly lipoprotein